MNVNTPIDYSPRYSVGHFCCRIKQGKRLSKFLQKYNDSGTETVILAGYSILVFKYVKISAGLPLLFIRAIRERSSKIRYCIIWRCLHLMFSTTNVSDKWNMQGLQKSFWWYFLMFANSWIYWKVELSQHVKMIHNNKFNWYVKSFHLTIY